MGIRGIFQSPEMAGLHMVTFERTIEDVLEAIEIRDAAMAKHREKRMADLAAGLQEEREKKLDPETVLRILKGRHFHNVMPQMTDRVQKVVKAAEVVTRIDAAREIYAFMIEQLKVENQVRTIFIPASEAMTLFRPFDAEAFEEDCCGGALYATPALSQVGSLVRNSGIGQLGPAYSGQLDSLEAALSASEADGMGLAT
jgi:hypothetical protein